MPHALKHAPGRATSSTGNTPQRVPDAGSSPQGDKTRLRAAVAAVKAVTGATNDDIADRLGVPLKTLSRMLESDPSRRVRPEALREMERWAASVRSGVSDEDVVRVLREFCRARSAFERLCDRLTEVA